MNDPASSVPEYDALAEFYDLWSAADPAFEPTRSFYVDYCRSQPGLVVEIGVGTGRIALDIAATGTRVHGIDVSSTMLETCRKRHGRSPAARTLTLECMDVRDMNIEEEAMVVICPFRTIGHLLTMEAKAEAFARVHDTLAPEGRFVFDHYVFDAQWAHAHNGVPRLMVHETSDNKGGVAIWDTYRYDFTTQRMACTITHERLSPAGEVVSRTHHPLAFSWVTPEQVKEIAGKAGLTVEALYGDFRRSPFTPSSRNQVWILVRSGGADQATLGNKSGSHNQLK
ncbi:MAG: class I SAM-dependent methyltransferase [Lentisphaerae bacterium]|jgi:SAM-dependent methyltransferase|nr:class I SAM-dependent methyltransferase [Lentisphaerota bacterium]MBT7055419.1 class I SAM-dependent methyltransferase [Lentisphaerota bacterium]